MKRLITATAMGLCLGTAAQASTFSTTFGPNANFNDGPDSRGFSLVGLDSTISGDLLIDFTVMGDLGSSNESFEVFFEGTSFGVGCDENTANDTFGIADDECSQSDNSFSAGQLRITESIASGLLADGALSFSFDTTGSADNLYSITNGGFTSSGVFFGDTSSASFIVGGTVSYDTSPTSVIPLPASMPLILVGLGALAVMNRRRARG